MKKIMPLLFLLAMAGGPAVRAAEPPPAEAQSAAGNGLSADRIEVLYLARGRATTVQLRTHRKVERIFPGDELVAFEYDPKMGQVRLTPSVDSGEENMNITIDGETYVWLLRIVPPSDQKVQYRRTFTLERDAGELEESDESVLGKAPPMKPYEVDIIGLSKIADRAGRDIEFRRTYPMLRTKTFPDKYYSWNDSMIRLTEVNQFLEQDILLFKVEWVNRTKFALCLDARQYGLMVANQKIPITAATQLAPTAVVFPGQYEVVWLAVQGYRLRRDNDWQLVLPPDANALAPMTR